MSSTAYVGFGSNLGNRELAFVNALEALGGLDSTLVKAHSGLYQTKPVGLSDAGPDFLNAVVELETELPPRRLMKKLRKIERMLGKSKQHESHLSRIIDLDLLLYDNIILGGKDLQIPHPRMHARAFVLVPLASLDPKILHPALKCSIGRLLEELPENEKEGVIEFDPKVQLVHK